MKVDEYHTKSSYETQLVEFKELLNNKIELIENYEEELQKKNDKL